MQKETIKFHLIPWLRYASKFVNLIFSFTNAMLICSSKIIELQPLSINLNAKCFFIGKQLILPLVEFIEQEKKKKKKTSNLPALSLTEFVKFAWYQTKLHQAYEQETSQMIIFS